jgi:diguanylate cyclase (GGDEF)-like protein
VRLKTRAAWRAWPLWAMWLLAGVYVATLALHGTAWSQGWANTATNGWLGELSLWVPVAVGWLAVYRVGLRRREILLAAAAVTAFAAGDTYFTAMTIGGATLPFPSLADVGYLAFYPVMLIALIVKVRRRTGALASSVSLDSAVGFLGAAAILAILLSPVLASAAQNPGFLAKAVAVTYPLFDLLLVATVAGIATLEDLHGSRWALLVAGLLVFAAADVVYGRQVSAGTYVMGTPLDAGWTIGLVMMATWIDSAASDRRVSQTWRPASDETALAVSTVATVAGLAVLLVGTRVHLSTLAVALAGVTLLAAAARAQLAFRRLARMAHERRLTASTDDLTGLPNRRALYSDGGARLTEQSRRHALLMLDLDKFKEVNDSLGHRAGDQLLVQVGARLGQQLRAGDMLARLGGDEFAVLLDDAGREEAGDVAAKLRGAVRAPFTLDDVSLHSSVSVGIALFPEDGRDLTTLLRKADIAMYKAKTSLRGQHLYSNADDAEDATRLQTVEELRTAFSSGQIVVHYQPKIDLPTGDVHAVEALVRWNHPTAGLLYPDQFLPLVEECGLMPTLTRVVLAQALDQAAYWHAQAKPLVVAVNLSASSLADSDLPKQVTSMLAARGIAPQDLQLEINEAFLMADRDQASSILNKLRRSGVQISVSDFGTSYSSLSYLRDLPIDELKLDRSFIFPITADDRTATLVTSTIELAHSLGLRMVAEGVESDVDYQALSRLGCDQAQGYFMSRPVPAAELEYWLSNRPAADGSKDHREPGATQA